MFIKLRAFPSLADRRCDYIRRHVVQDRFDCDNTLNRHKVRHKIAMMKANSTFGHPRSGLSFICVALLSSNRRGFEGSSYSDW